LKPVDIEFMRHLSPYAPIIPVIGKADTLASADIPLLKAAILSDLQASSIRPFLFGKSTEEALQSSTPLPPFAVSSATAADNDTMDASLLMSPDYVQPLVSTELVALVEQILSRDIMSWLRHTAAKNFLLWREGSIAKSMTVQPIHSPLSHHSSDYSPIGVSASTSGFGSPSPSNKPQLHVSPIGATTSYALARVADHTQREERLAQARLARWAVDLQRSIDNERARFEMLARGERAVWLTERLGECVLDGTLVPINAGQNTALVKPNASTLAAHARHFSSPGGRGTALLDPRDPLGLLQWKDSVKKHGWQIFQVVGSFGVIGGLAIWVARNWSESLSEWRWDWWNTE
jgi:hypothetical protein